MGSAKKDKKAAKKALAKAAQEQARAAAAAAEVEAAEAADPLLRLRNNLMSQFRKYLRDVTGDPTPDATWIEFLFHVPVQSKKMLLASTAEILAETVYVRATKGIDKCYLEPKDNPKTYVVSPLPCCFDFVISRRRRLGLVPVIMMCTCDCGCCCCCFCCVVQRSQGVDGHY